MSRRHHDEHVLVGRLMQDSRLILSMSMVAYRRGERSIRSFDPIRLPPAVASPWRAGGVYLITGGLGGIGLAVGEQIAASAEEAALVLVGRTAMPDESTWRGLLAADDTDASDASAGWRRCAHASRRHGHHHRQRRRHRRSQMTHSSRPSGHVSTTSPG